MSEPIQVNPSQLPGIVGTVLRYGVVFLVGRGVLPDSTNAEQVVSALIALGTVAWGVYKTFTHKQQLVTAANAAPDHVAVVK